MRSITIIFILASFFILGFTPPTPPGSIAPYLDGVFPDQVPGDGGNWTLKEEFEGMNFVSPLYVVDFPKSDQIIISEKRGKLFLVDELFQTKRLVLDIAQQVFSKADCGFLGFAFHPDFPNTPHLYTYYKTKPEPEVWADNGFSRLSKFTWDSEQEIFLPESEEILFQQYDQSPWHNGGRMLFGPDGFLYLAIGDEGFDEHRLLSTQNINRGLFSGVLRIDVDKDATKSHPIRRQPITNSTPPDGWGETYSQGYYIPNDNPWQDENGEILEEFYAVGLRSPFGLFYDKEEDNFWVSDVGSDKREEVTIFQKGDNLQWPFKEGTVDFEPERKPEPMLGTERKPVFDYSRSLGSCIVSGSLYQKDLYPELKDKYLFGDYTGNKIMMLDKVAPEERAEMNVLINSLDGHGITYGQKPGVSGVHVLDDGRVYVTVISENFEDPGYVLELRKIGDVADPPSKLSDLNVFTDLENLTVREGILPYEVNAPLWSDGATKKRWIAIPNDGTYSSLDEKITFNATQDYKFPEGTVFIKHFDLPIDDSGNVVKLETRFFVIAKDGKRYGVTYKWNEEGTDAFLLKTSEERDIEVFANGEYEYTQTWKYPSRDQCMTCHNYNANSVLGFKTHQLNRLNEFEGVNGEINQLEYFNNLGVFHRDIGNANQFEKAYGITEDIHLKTRIRSYLDANCASCHRTAGVSGLDMDLRFQNTYNIEKYFFHDNQSHASTQDGQLITPGEHATSEIWIRDASESDNKMPPLGRDLVDKVYIDSLTKWIDGLEPNNIAGHNEVLIYPNPTTDYIIINVNESWELPIQVVITSGSGRPIRNFSLTQNFGSINLSSFPSGVYIVKVKSGEKEKYNKVVLQ